MIARTARGAPRGIAARPSVRRRAVEPETVAVVTSGGAVTVGTGAGVTGAGATGAVTAGAGAGVGAGVGNDTSGSGPPGNEIPAWAEAGAGAAIDTAAIAARQVTTRRIFQVIGRSADDLESGWTTASSAPR